MKRLKHITILLLISSACFGQSKWTFGLQFNQSAVTSPTTDICILRTSSGNCYDLQGNWKLAPTFLANKSIGKRFNFQTGLGINRLHFDQINEEIGGDKFKYSYISIPVKAHYFFNLGKFKTYLGAGFRVDVKINGDINSTPADGVYDNSSGFGINWESLIGFAYMLNEKINIHLEPTYSFAITDYDTINNPRPLSIPNWSLWNEKPERIGISLGVTFKPQK